MVYNKKNESEKIKMEIIWKFILFIFYSSLIVVISKYLLVPVLRKLAESLNLKPKTVGNITGIATSVPELLTVSFAALTGLAGASIYNILSSNIINVIQFSTSVYLNKNQKLLKNRALNIDLIMVLITIIIPLLLLLLKIETSITIVPIFILLFLLFYFIDVNAHKIYLNKKTSEEKKIEEEMKWIKGKKRIIIKYTIYLILISILLYFSGNLLSNVLEVLAVNFKIPQIIIGILLGFITSVPELITFFESQKHYKKKEDTEEGIIEATNNLLTSNILNLFVIQTIGIIIYNFIK